MWRRPFDDPTPRVTREAEALHRILSLADEARLEIIGSGVVLYEASFIRKLEKREGVLTLFRKSITTFVEISDDVERVAAVLMSECGLDDMDAAHVAAAIDSGADIFLTTDDGILGIGACLSKFGVIVKNPVGYSELVRR